MITKNSLNSIILNTKLILKCYNFVVIALSFKDILYKFMIHMSSKLLHATKNYIS